MSELSSVTLEGRRVLIVEDEYLLAADLAERFIAIGVEVVGPAGTLRDAIGLIETHDLEGAVLDINVRGERIYPVADMLREKNVPFVFTSGYSIDLEPAAYAKVPRCIKPVSFSAVAQMLSSAMNS